MTHIPPWVSGEPMTQRLGVQCFTGGPQPMTQRLGVQCFTGGPQPMTQRLGVQCFTGGPQPSDLYSSDLNPIKYP